MHVMLHAYQLRVDWPDATSRPWREADHSSNLRLLKGFVDILFAEDITRLMLGFN